nr:His/Gly/Thr/Pro-type tRNA ligase C-terminal domain-containing protein [Candidatus Omnitrophota bacterium]
EAALKAVGLRVRTDERDEKMQRKIRDAEMEKVPYMAVVGSREMETASVSLRSRKDGNLGTVTVEQLAENLSKEVSTKAKA